MRSKKEIIESIGHIKLPALTGLYFTKDELIQIIKNLNTIEHSITDYKEQLLTRAENPFEREIVKEVTGFKSRKQNENDSKMSFEDIVYYLQKAGFKRD